MGYYEAKIIAARFVVPPDRADDALRGLLAWADEELGLDLADRELTSLDEFLAMFSISTVRDGDTVVGLEFEDLLLLETEDVFRELGPFVAEGSFVRMHAGTGQRWRYDFDGQRMHKSDEPGTPWYGR